MQHDDLANDLMNTYKCIKLGPIPISYRYEFCSKLFWFENLLREYMYFKFFAIH